MPESTARLTLPLIAPGQAQKEMSHNEALALIDLLVQGAVVAVGTDAPPPSPAPGECWVVGATPSGTWSGHAHAIAGWTAGGWRFAAPREGMTVWTGGAGGFARYTGGAWSSGALRGTVLTLGGDQVVGARRAAIADPAGGSIVDSEARAAVAAVLGALRGHGLIAP
ncbi:MAG: DUF2793 domain-containing protein [Pseudomonadota bacterium]